jgi:tRNA A37 threonylcarbamoyladenosine synthetase subunit TsaC/SUA5/YrdC
VRCKARPSLLDLCIFMIDPITTCSAFVSGE